MKRFWAALLSASLWLVALGLMLASSGLDGAYLARWMTDLPGIGGAALLGYVLNTTADVAGLVLTYWYGRLQLDQSATKRKRSAILLVAELIATGYSGFFSWRQLRLVLPAVEGDAARWVAPVSAGFIPLLLAFIGYAQALLAGRIERNGNGNQEAQVTRQEAAEAHEVIPEARKVSQGAPNVTRSIKEAIEQEHKAHPVTIEAHSVKPEAQLQETSRADAIRKAHKAHPEYTQVQLAQLAGCSRGYVSKVVGNRA